MRAIPAILSSARCSCGVLSKCQSGCRHAGPVILTKMEVVVLCVAKECEPNQGVNDSYIL